MKPKFLVLLAISLGLGACTVDVVFVKTDLDARIRSTSERLTTQIQKRRTGDQLKLGWAHEISLKIGSPFKWMVILGGQGFAGHLANTTDEMVCIDFARTQLAINADSYRTWEPTAAHYFITVDSQSKFRRFGDPRSQDKLVEPLDEMCLLPSESGTYSITLNHPSGIAQPFFDVKQNGKIKDGEDLIRSVAGREVRLAIPFRIGSKREILDLHFRGVSAEPGRIRV